MQLSQGELINCSANADIDFIIFLKLFDEVVNMKQKHILKGIGAFMIIIIPGVLTTFLTYGILKKVIRVFT